MAKQYETFVRDSAQILSGRVVAIALRDLTPGKKKYRGINVRAVVSRPPKKGEPTLWIRSVVGVKEPKPASVRIVEELPETLMAIPYTDFFEVLKKAGAAMKRRSGAAGAQPAPGARARTHPLMR